jgi:dTDP-4-amino-4,6-dideoxy-D-galactose acyltransferase
MGQVSALAESRKKELFFYSPYNFIRSFPVERQLENCVYDVIRNFEGSAANMIIPVAVNGHEHQFYVSYLEWDSNYFGLKTYKLVYVLYNHQDIKILIDAVKKFKDILFSEPVYCFIEIPSEDIKLIEALCANSFMLVETRLTYFMGNLEVYDKERYPVRKAEAKDIPNLRRVSAEMRNDFDRFHADPVFSTDKADKFLATYIEKSVEGLADIVLIPNEPDMSSDSFFTAKYMKSEWEKNQCKISRIVLVAAGNKGWHKKLMSEMTYHLRDTGAEFIYMNTQSTNRAVMYNCESLGYRFGCTTHILSCNNL